MAKIDFYILAEGNAKSRFQLACRLIEKAYKNQRRVYVHTDNEKEAHWMDELLWTYRDDAFIPHHLLGEGPDPAPPVQIGYQTIPENHKDILVNLSLKVPDFFGQFNRVLELVPNDQDIQASARENFRFYRAQNHEIITHKLQTIES